MKQFGFVVYDMYGNINCRLFLSSVLAQLDMSFACKEGAFRKSHLFATPEQRKAFAWNPDPHLAAPVKE
jgi:hypothetical protein